ncbi:MAG: HD domain-containing protein [Candidatus Cloacimonetes bacterium]|nr:HD domain-containing protein [Candidatus Cloacimonadota bacterium]
MKKYKLFLFLILLFCVYSIINSLNINNNPLINPHIFIYQTVLLVLIIFVLVYFFLNRHKLSIELKKEIVEREKVEKQLLDFSKELEKNVKMRTEELNTEIETRKEIEIKLKRSYSKLEKVLEDTVNALVSAIEKRDLYTAGHQKKVALLACAIGEELGFNKHRNEGLLIAAKLHDIGKISIPAEILNRPGRLLKQEFDIVKTHSQAGYDILKGINFPWPIAEIVLQHHEKIDGSGYPKGLKGNKIILEAKIICLANVIIAMSSHRPFVPSTSLDSIFDEIRGLSGFSYEPKVVKACLKVIKKSDINYQLDN